MVQVINSNNQVRQDALSSNNGTNNTNNSAANSRSAATDRLVTTLAENVPGLSEDDVRDLRTSDFSPERVASRISNFVASGLEQARARGASEEQLTRLYNDALEGVERGFREATEILEDLDLLTPDIQATIDTTFDLTFEALTGLAPNSNETAPSRQVSLSAAERFSRSESFSLDVTTQEGDTISIRFNSEASETVSVGAVANSGGVSAAAFSLERNASSAFSFTVEGNLNEDELDALQNLIQDVNLIADDFFNGDIQSAFDQAAEFQLDNSELLNLNLTLRQSTSFSAATAYEAVQQQTSPLGNNGRQLGQFLNGAQQLFRNPALEFIQDRTQFGTSLIDQLVREDVRFQDADDETQSRFGNNLGVLNDIIEQFGQDPV